MSIPICFLCNKDLVDNTLQVTSITCGHVFHTACYSCWNKMSGHCPLCKIDFYEDNVIKNTLTTKDKTDGKKTPEQVAMQLSDFYEQIDDSDDPIERLKLLGQCYEELHYFFTGRKNDFS